MGSWLTRLFDLDNINTASDTLANTMERHAPGDKWRNQKLVNTALKDMVAFAKGEKRKHGWGQIKLAILSNKLLWKLIDKGYTRELSKQVSTDLSILLAQDINIQNTAKASPKKNKS